MEMSKMNDSLQDKAIEYIENNIDNPLQELIVEWERILQRSLSVEEYAALCGAYDIGYSEACRTITALF